MGFDLFKAAKGAVDAATGVAKDAVDMAAEAAKDTVDAAAGVAWSAVDIAGKAAGECVQQAACGAAAFFSGTAQQIGNLVVSVISPEEAADKAVYSGEIRSDAGPTAVKRINVRRITLNKDNECEEGRLQTLRLSSSGVELLASVEEDGITNFFSSQTSAFSKRGPAVMDTLKVSNCFLYKKGKEHSVNPIESIIGGTALGIFAGIVTQHPMGFILFTCWGIWEAFPEDRWYLDVFTHNKQEYVFRIDNKRDGETFLEFLDSYMYIPRG